MVLNDSAMVWRLGAVEINPTARRLLVDGRTVSIGGRAWDLLQVLLERRGDLVSKRELMARVWPRQVVEGNNLTVQISALRKALGPELVVTIPGRGYMLAHRLEPVRARAEPGLSVVVLPFTAAASADQGVADGLTDEVIAALGRFRSLYVQAPGSGHHARDRGLSMPELASQLGVRFAVEGRLRRTDEVVRVGVRLVLATEGRLQWADNFDAPAGAMLELQDRMARAIASALQPQLEFAERTHLPPSPAAGAAYPLALRAWATLRRHDDPDDAGRRERARTLAREALKINPRCALAARTIAWSQYSELVIGYSDQTVREARAAVALLSDVLSADPLDHHAFHFRGALRFQLRDYDDALEDLRRAHALNVNDPATLSFLGFAESACGHPERGIPLAREALQLSPRDPYRYLMHNHLAVCLASGQQWEQCLSEGRLSVTDAPWCAPAWLWLAVAAQALGDTEQARAAAETTRRLAPGYLAARLRGEWTGSCPDYRRRATDLLRAVMCEPFTAPTQAMA